MKSILCVAVCSALLSLGAQAQTAPAAAPAPAQQNATVLPGDDFYTYVNGAWMNATEIPADKSAWGAGGQLAEDTNQRIVKMIEGLAADKKAKGEARQVGDYYAAYMDEAGIEAKGLAPMKPMLAQIDAIKDKAALTKMLGASLRTDVDALNSTNFYTENLFGLWVVQGLTDPDHYTPYMLQGGLGLPDRAYYVDSSKRMADLRTGYQQYMANMFKLAGYSDPEARAKRVMDLETKIANVHATREESVDVLKANNQWTLADFKKNAPGLDWDALFKAAKLGGQKKFIVWHPGAAKGEAALVASEDLQAWKDWLVFHRLNHYAGVLPKAFVDARFEFMGKALSGTPQQSVRWKRGLSAVNGAMDEAVGHLYVDRYFPAESKARIQEMVKNIVAAFDARIDKLDWMNPATKAEAKRKLKVLYVGVGYPDKWKSYAGLKVSPTDAFGNAVRAEEYATAQELAKLGKKVDRTEWSMPPQLVNAVNMPMQNALNFPAAILQPPYFDPKASDAVNYGAIGSIIGHEISHSFDDQGAQFDSQGRLRDWWTKEDGEHFRKASQALAAQYSAYKPFDDLALNGQLTLSENLADLAGLAAAYDALHTSLHGKAASPELDREFFSGFAMGWRTKMREATLRRAVLTDGHAPAQWRTYTVRNLDPWYNAFNVQPGQKLYLAPEQRVRVW
ncbi:M13 family peptidase [Massilia arenosa]|uniref:M13 family peptidase n=1 Tax=Zemynaea arenosa TaxID=2561931 RepID=A0A4Y9SJ96_9BURK|nr:M13 family metallopeptidase [Massilia arenosa]TFW25990.1 M13 family peptidase [Massilia arenosa]